MADPAGAPDGLMAQGLHVACGGRPASSRARELGVCDRERRQGKQLGTSVSVISRYERGEMTPSIETAKRLADALNTSIAYLLGDAGDDDLLRDPELVRRLRTVADFAPDEQERVYFTLDAVIREIQNRKVYA